jgi:hypothetical protein
MRAQLSVLSQAGISYFTKSTGSVLRLNLSPPMHTHHQWRTQRGFEVQTLPHWMAGHSDKGGLIGYAVLYYVSKANIYHKPRTELGTWISNARQKSALFNGRTTLVGFLTKKSAMTNLMA